VTQTLTRLGDRMLSIVLRTEDAGACVPEYGQPCGSCRQGGTGYCGSDGHWYWRYYRGRYTCTGACSGSSVYCYSRRSGAIC